MDIWIKSYIDKLPIGECHYTFYEYLASESVFFEERRRQILPVDYEERRQAYMLEF